MDEPRGPLALNISAADNTAAARGSGGGDAPSRWTDVAHLSCAARQHEERLANETAAGFLRAAAFNKTEHAGDVPVPSLEVSRS